MNTFAFDTETFRIGPGAVAPKMVCLTIAAGNMSSLHANGDSDIVDTLRSLFQLGHLLVGQNVAYDCVVIAISYPELEPLIWAKYAAGEITCTKLQEQLINLATHGKLDVVKMPDGSNIKLRYSLDVLENKYLGIDRSDQKTGDDQWRMNYHLLDGKKAEEYPDDARAYAEDDARGTLLVHEAQVACAPAEALDIAPFQAWADFALFLITERGMATDGVELERVKAELAEDLTPEKLMPLVDAGILRKGEGPRPHSRQLPQAMKILGKLYEELPEDWEMYRVTLEAEGIKFTKGVKPSIDTKKLASRVEKFCREYDIPIKKTPTDTTSTDSEVMEDLQGLDEVLDTYRERQSLQKLITTDIPRMQWEGETAETVHFPFRALIETGRTSSFANKLFPSGNGQQLHPKIRPCYVAREGYVLLSTDYSTLELATVGQRMIDLFGHSVHADKINAGQDLHSFLAARLAFELSAEFRATCDQKGLTSNDDLYTSFMKCKKHKIKELADFHMWWRKFAKPVGLGYPGGLGPWTFLGFSKKTYGVNIAELAEELPDDRFNISKPLLRLAKKHLNISEMEFRWTGATKALALALKLKNIWLDTFQMRPYYEYIQKQHKDHVNNTIGETDEGKAIQGYTYTSDFGMIRRGCSYPSVCNGFAMQTPAAEGAKVALILTVRACRDKSFGSILYNQAHPVNFIHDELLTEHRDKGAARLDAEAKEVSRIMLDAMKLICPDIPGLKTEGVFMREWNKFADPTFNSQGLLIVTKPAAPIT